MGRLLDVHVPSNSWEHDLDAECDLNTIPPIYVHVHRELIILYRLAVGVVWASLELLSMNDTLNIFPKNASALPSGP